MDLTFSRKLKHLSLSAQEAQNQMFFVPESQKIQNKEKKENKQTSQIGSLSPLVLFAVLQLAAH